MGKVEKENIVEITISIDISELGKNMMAELALSVASKKCDEGIAPLLFDRCNINKLIEVKAREACLTLCGKLAGYVSSFSSTGSVIAIVMGVASQVCGFRCDLLRELFEKAVVKTVLYDFLKGSEFHTEAEEFKIASLKAESGIKQMLALE